MNISELTLQEQVRTGCRYAAEIDHTDLSDTAATTKTLTFDAGGVLGDVVDRVLIDLVTEFDGGATSELTVQVGYDLAAGTDDPNGLAVAQSLHADATPINTGVSTLAVAFLESYSLTALFTATGANLSTLTAGRARIYFNKISLPELRNINAE